MLTHRSFPLILAAALALPLVAQDRNCATDPGTSAYVRAVHAANAGRLARLRASSIAAPVERRNGMFVVGKTPENSLLDHPNDLEGRSVRFVPAAGGRFETTVQTLQYDTNVGTPIRAFTAGTSSDWSYVKVSLKTVTLPLFGQTTDTIYVTAFNSIALVPPQPPAAVQYDAAEASFVYEPTIAPLLLTNRWPYGFNLPTAYLRESSDGVTVTWRSAGAYAYDVQAKMASNGEITFSYRTLGDVTWGAVLITPGVAAFVPNLDTVAHLDAPADDVSAEAPRAARAALDIRGVTLQQVAGRGACLLTIDTGVAAGGSMLPPRGDTEIVKVTFGDAPPLTMMLSWNGGVSVSQPGRAALHTSIAGVNGNQLQIGFLVDFLRPIAATTHMVVETSLQSMSAPADRLAADVALSDGEVPGVELSSSSGIALRLPIVDAFTWPTVDLESVWESVRAAAAFDDAQIDGVAIYQNFHTDVTIANIAFATIGNPQVDGVWKYAGHTSALPRSPNLMNLNDVNYGANSPLDNGRIVLHEFGHHWLQFVEAMENGTATMTLNPAPSHPPQFAATPAAFPVVNAYDTSTMGGGTFAQNGSYFTSAPRSPYGYSWLDLYLMGLAAPEEVPPMYVIDHSVPPLGNSYNPPGNITVTGTRHDVTIQQVIEAMGPRRPSTASSQRLFRIVFVLVATSSRDVDADLARVDAIRRAFADNFEKATGHRASVATLFFPSANHHRAVRP